MATSVCILQVLNAAQDWDTAYLFQEYARRISQDKIRFDFLLCGETPPRVRQQLEAQGNRVFSLPHRWLGTAAARRELAAFFRQHADYDGVHCHLEQESGFVLEAAQRAGIAVRICHAHGTRLRHTRYRLRSGSRQLNASATHFFAESAAAAERLFGVSRLEQVLIFPQFVDSQQLSWDAEKRKTVRRLMNLSARTLLIACPDPMMERADWNRLRRILHCLRQRYPDCHLLLPSELECYRPILRRRKWEGIAVTIAASREQLLHDFSAVDVCLFPSARERISYSLIQAQCADIPCVISQNIPREAVFHPEVCTLPLRRCPEQWVEYSMLAAAQVHRRSQAEAFRQYDLLYSPSWLEELYEEECGVK
ncbi:MAG: glycosyltransferase [Butyricicoccus sp.]